MEFDLIPDWADSARLQKQVNQSIIFRAAMEDIASVRSFIPNLAADDLARVQQAAQELADLAWKELEKR